MAADGGEGAAEQTLEQMLAEMKAEEAEGAEGAAKRRAADAAAERAEEVDQKAKAEENRRKVAAKNASKAEKKKEEHAAAEEKKEASRRAQLERQELKRRKKNAVPDWAVKKAPSEQDAPVLSQQQVEAQAWAKRTRSLKRHWTRNKDYIPCGLVCLLFLWCSAIAIQESWSSGEDDSPNGMVEMTFLAAGKEPDAALAEQLVKQQEKWHYSNDYTTVAQQALNLGIAWTIKQLNRKELIALLEAQGTAVVSDDDEAEQSACEEAGGEDCDKGSQGRWSTTELRKKARHGEYHLYAQMDPTGAAKQMVLHPTSDFARSLRAPSKDPEWLDYIDQIKRDEIHLVRNGLPHLTPKFGDHKGAPVVSDAQLEAAFTEQKEEGYAHAQENNAWLIENERRRKVAYAGSRTCRMGAIRWEPTGEFPGPYAERSDHRDYHWSGDWSLAVPGAWEAQRHALAARRGAMLFSLST